MLLSILGFFALIFNMLPAEGNSIHNFDDGVTLFDFTKQDTTDGWIEVSDTAREVGKSKAAFTLQKTQLFSRAIFFSLLNPQVNGACFAGVVFYKHYNLLSYKIISLNVRGQGENEKYKVVFHHKGLNGDPNPSYEQVFSVPKEQFVTISLPLDQFKAYLRGQLVPDAEPLDIANISSIGIQVYGGVYEQYKQKGVSSLEIDWIKVHN